MVENQIHSQVDVVLYAGGGAGSLRPITEFIPKAMLPLGNKPIIHHILESITRSCNIGQIFIFVNYYKEMIIEYVNLLVKAGIIKAKIHFVETPLHGAGSFGSGGCLPLIEKMVGDTFLLYYSDVLAPALNFSELLAAHSQNRPDNMLGTLVTSTHYRSEVGCVELGSDNYLKCFVEKPSRSDRIINMAIGVFDAGIIKHVSRKEDNFFGDIIPRVLNEGYLIRNFNYDTEWHHFQHISKYHYEHVINYERWVNCQNEG